MQSKLSEKKYNLKYTHDSITGEYTAIKKINKYLLTFSWETSNLIPCEYKIYQKLLRCNIKKKTIYSKILIRKSTYLIRITHTTSM